MNITINGEVKTGLPDGLSVAALIEDLGLPIKKLAIERNLVIVPKSTYGETVLKDGDVLEIVHFIGGG